MIRHVLCALIVAISIASSVHAEEWLECPVPGTRTFTFLCDKDGKAKPLTPVQAELGAALSRHVAAIQALRPEFDEGLALQRSILSELRALRGHEERREYRRICRLAWGPGAAWCR